MPQDKAPHILLINRVYPPQRGTTGRLLRDLARALAQDGWHVTVLATGDASGQEMDGPVRVIRRRASRRPRSIPAYGWTALRLSLAALRIRAKVIVTMTDPPLLAVPAGLVARLKGARHIHWSQDVYPDLLPILGVNPPAFAMNVARRLMRRALRSCHHVVAIGGCMGRRFVERASVNPQRLSVIPNWPDSELVFGETDRRSRPRDYQLLDTPEDARAAEELHRDASPKFRVLYSGTLGFAHPLDTILDAAALLAESHPEIQFVFAGDGPAFERLARERTARGLENIRLLPWQPASRLRELMESGDVHLISMDMRAECLLVPSKIYSALAAGRPAIFVGPCGSDAARAVENSGAGAVVPQGDGKLLAETIAAFRENPDRWFTAHEAALRTMAQFLPKASLASWLTVARNVAQKKVKVARAK